MSIKRTIITTIVALALVAVVAPGVTQAVTIDELLAQIAQLQAQLVALQGNSGATPVPTGNVACSGVTFTRNLTVGSTGQDVKCLQVLLNTNGYTLAATGAGSPGNETSYFGSITLAAVKSFQAAKGWTPANQVGPLTRAALNALVGGTTTTTTTTPGQPVVVVPTGTGLTVQLASDNPAAGIVVAGQGLAPLAKFVFVNGDNAAVKVTSLKVTRVGISADADLANVYLLNGAVRLTDSASLSTGVVNFNDPNGLFTVPAGGSTTITVASDICTTTNCTTIVGQTIGVSMASAANISTDASAVRGNFPVNGNLFTVSNASLATVTFALSTSSPSTNTSLNPQNDYPIWQNSTVIGTRTVNMTRMAFRLIGSVYSTDLQNFRLNVDGVNVGSAVANADANGYVTFDLRSSPVALQTGTRVIKVLADIVNGSSRTFNTSIRVAADANFVDSQYGVNIAPYTTNGSSSFLVADVTTGTQTIASGSVTVVKATDSPSGNIVNTASNAVLAKYTLTAAGEPVKITDLYVRAVFYNTTGTDDCDASATCTAAASMTLRNGALYANGVQIGSTANLSPATAGTHFSLGSSLVVYPGSPVTLEVRADIYDETGTYNDVDATDTVYAEIVSTANNAQDMISLATATVPGTNTDGNTLTVAAGSLTLSKYTAYTNKTVVAPVTAYKLGHFTLTSSATEATNLNTIYADLTTNTTVISNLYVTYGSQRTTATVTPSATTLANSWSINYTLPAGQTIDIAVYGDVSSLATTSVYTSVKVTGTTASSATSVTTGSVLAGQTITFGSGSINAIVDGTTPANQAVSGNQQVAAGKFKFTASNDNYTITEARFTVQGTNGNVIKAGVLKDGSTVLGTVPYDSTNDYFYFTGLNVAVAANTTKVLTLDLSLVTPFTEGVAATTTTGQNVAVTLSYIKTLNSSGVMHDAGTSAGSTAATVTVASSTSGTSAANYVYVYKTVPTFTLGTVTGQGAALASNTTTNLYSFTVAAPASGAVSLRQLKFAVTATDNTSNSATARFSTFKFSRGSTELVAAGSAYIRNSSGTDITGSTTITSDTISVIFYPEEVIPAGSTYTYTLKATPVSFAALGSSGNDSVSTSLSNDSTPAGVSAGADTARFYLDATGNTTLQTLATTAAGAGTGTASNVIWSDNSAKSHDYTYDGSSSDWFNGYLINNLPLDAVGITAGSTL